MAENEDLFRFAVLRVLRLASTAKISLRAYCQFTERLLAMKNDQFGVAIAKFILSCNERDESILARNIMLNWGHRVFV